MLRNFTIGLKHWLKGGPLDSRRAPRYREPSIVVRYWDGSAPEGHRIRDISTTGAYIITKERWCAGTIVRLILRGYKPSPVDTDPVPSQTTTIYSRIVRQEPDGMAVDFLFPTSNEREALEKFLASIPKTSIALAVPSSPAQSI